MIKAVIQRWAEVLVAHLQELLDRDGRVTVIALSRKMPRLLQVLLSTYINQDTADQLKAILDDPRCEYTTEIALPLLFPDSELVKSEIIILDDIVVSGRTLSVVCDVICSAFNKKPYVHTILINKSTNLSSEFEYLDDSCKNEIDATDIHEYLDLFSKLVRDFALPVDLEFPIFTATDINFVDLVNMVSQYSDGSRQYFSEDCKNYTLLLEDEIRATYNNDFAKIRIFDTNNGVRIACYAPNVFRNSQILSNNLFLNPNYADLWKLISDKSWSKKITKDAYKHRREEELISKTYIKTLVVIVNFLFSMSAFIRHRELFGNMWALFNLSKQDLQLIFGKALTNEIYPVLRGFMSSGEESRSQRMIPDAMSCSVPSFIEEDYIGDTLIDSFRSGNVSDFVMAVFADGQRYQRKIPTVIKEYCLESFSSLLSRPRTYLSVREAEIEINKLVDRLIDEGYVIPVYHFVLDMKRSAESPLYWRRFFRASNRDLQKFSIHD